MDHLHAARPTDRISQNTNASFAAIPAFSWRDVESEDYRQYVQNLRRLGCPEATVDDIAIADVNALFLNRAKPILDDLR